MGKSDLAAYYAEDKRRHRIAEREFRRRRHGWRFDLAPDAVRWADAHAAASAVSAAEATEATATDTEHNPHDPFAWTSRLVEAADAAGMIVKPEPGGVRSAFSAGTRSPRTPSPSGSGSGRRPPSS